MLTLRILKKKSKQAREILTAHYGYQEKRFFLAEKHANYHGFRIRCGHPVKNADLPRGCNCQWHPLPGTPMTGEVSGYYEPEWDERTALQDLQNHVMWDKRPATMSNGEWKRTLAIARVEPVTEADIEEWLREDDDLDVEAAA